MSMFLLLSLSVCSLISLSVSSCMLASTAGPSRYHGDGSRHRLSAVISCMLPAGIFLDSSLVIICFLSFIMKPLSPSLSLSSVAWSFSHIPPLWLLLSFWPSSTPVPSYHIVSSPRWQNCISRNPQPLDLITDAQDGVAINTSHYCHSLILFPCNTSVIFPSQWSSSLHSAPSALCCIALSTLHFQPHFLFTHQSFFSPPSSVSLL